MAAEPLWLTAVEVIAVHADQIARYGGLPGFKDLGLIDSAVHAPRNSFAYAEERDVLMLALVLCRAIVKNHGFLDGNKRTAAASMLLFLGVNGYDLLVPDNHPEAPWLGRLVEGIATGNLPLPSAYAALLPYLDDLQ